MEFRKLNLSQGTERLKAYGFGQHTLNNLLALATGGGVAQLRMLRLVASATIGGTGFRVEVFEDWTAGRQVDLFEICLRNRVMGPCQCSPERQGVCDSCWCQMRHPATQE